MRLFTELILDIDFFYIITAALRTVTGSICLGYCLIAAPYTYGDVRFGNLICVPTPTHRSDLATLFKL